MAHRCGFPNLFPLPKETSGWRARSANNLPLTAKLVGMNGALASAKLLGEKFMIKSLLGTLVILAFASAHAELRSADLVGTYKVFAKVQSTQEVVPMDIELKIAPSQKVSLSIKTTLNDVILCNGSAALAGKHLFIPATCFGLVKSGVDEVALEKSVTIDLDLSSVKDAQEFNGQANIPVKAAVKFSGFSFSATFAKTSSSVVEEGKVGNSWYKIPANQVQCSEEARYEVGRIYFMISQGPHSYVTSMNKVLCKQFEDPTDQEGHTSATVSLQIQSCNETKSSAEAAGEKYLLVNKETCQVSQDYGS